MGALKNQGSNLPVDGPEPMLEPAEPLAPELLPPLPAVLAGA